jgi:hypothetical protein
MKVLTLKNISLAFVICAVIGWEVVAEVHKAFPHVDNIWKTLLNIKWKKTYNADFKAEIDMPIFSPEVKALEGKTIVISGYVLPTDLYEGNFTVLSVYPMAQCFFCGGAGPESVIEVYTKNGKRSFATERVTFKGRLELNADDPSHLIYKLRDATVHFSEE